MINCNYITSQEFKSFKLNLEDKFKEKDNSIVNSMNN